MSTKATPLVVKVKKEVISDEINDYAETAMNELLGWYGYGNVDRNEVSGKKLVIPTNNTTTTTTTVTKSNQLNTNNNSSNNNNNNNNSITSSTKSSPSTPRQSIGNGIIVRTTSSTPERNSSPDNSKSPILKQIIDKQDEECGWCRRPVSHSSPEFLATPEGPRYCTESCFAQSRRASFKRAKTCDWCKHIRHAVSYVDFQDGASQLQFCSDKCLNQYKMQIFCKETQAHLDMNPHLKGKIAENDGGLITPDLWMKNCRSRSSSPASDRSKSISPIPQNLVIASLQKPDRSYKPVITVAPSSKLMSRPSPSISIVAKPIKPMKKRRSLRLCGIATNTHSNRHITETKSSNNHNHISPSNENTGQQTATKTSAMSHLQEISGANNSKSHSVNGLPNAKRQSGQNSQFLPPPPNLYPLRHPMFQGNRRFFPPHRSGSPLLHPPPPQIPVHAQTVLPSPTTPQLPSSQMPSMPQSHDLPFNFVGCTTPPVTILVPYPVVIPIPIPIPIPTPLSTLIKAAELKLNSKTTPKTTSTDEPLDCSKAKETPTEPKSVQPTETKRDIHRIEPSSPKSNDTTNDDQRLLKFKITRFSAKRHIAKEPMENCRPLRKRKRIVDCDYLRLRSEEDKRKN